MASAAAGARAAHAAARRRHLAPAFAGELGTTFAAIPRADSPRAEAPLMACSGLARDGDGGRRRVDGLPRPLPALVSE